MKCIRQATAQDASQISALRLSAYARAIEFKVIRPSLIEWNKKDDDRVVLSAWNDAGMAISTMRGEIVYDRQEAEDALACTVKLDISLYPSLALTKGATSLDQSNSGLNSALRYYFLQAALDSPVQSVIGLVYINASRTRLMESLGYMFQTPDDIWDPADITLKPGLFATLSRDRISNAIAQLSKLSYDCLTDYPWEGSALRLAVVHGQPQ